jgi:uncharacterized repeat protein (TIGR01451 family)
VWLNEKLLTKKGKGKMKPIVTSMTAKLMMHLAIALVVASAGATWCLATPAADISTTGPLTHIWVGSDQSSQVQHIADGTTHAFYPPFAIPGDAGTFIAIGDTLYAPDFFNHDATATDNTFPNIPFTPVSQSAVTGSGAATNPYKLVTTVGVGATGLSVEETDTYIAGREYYTTQIKITNNGTTDPATGVLYRAADAFLGGSDNGYGFAQIYSDHGIAVGSSSNPNNSPPGKIEEFIPLTAGSSYLQDRFDLVWGAIGSKMAFSDGCNACATLVDNGAGLSWSFSIPAGKSVAYSHVTTFSPLGFEGLVTSKTADSPTSTVGTQNGYTITIQNPNPNDVTVTSITDTLPAGFTYVGSSSGATNSNPAISGQILTWSGSFTVPGTGSISLHFLVTVANTPGDYLNYAGGSAAENYNVIGTGPTAKITVTAATTPSPSPSSTPPPTSSLACWNKYAVFGLNSVTLSNTGGGTGANNNPGVIGDVAIGGGTGSLLKTVINGRVFIDSSATPAVHSDCTATGGFVPNQNLSQDKAGVLNLSAQIAALQCTQSFGDITNTTTITGAPGQSVANVICVNSINLTKKNLTLVGNNTGTDVFLFNVTSPTALFVLNNAKVLLSGGLTANRVLFNFPGGGGSLQIYKASTAPVMNGMLLAPQRDIVIDNPPVVGSVIGSTIDIHSGGKATGVQCQ